MFVKFLTGKFLFFCKHVSDVQVFHVCLFLLGLCVCWNRTRFYFHTIILKFPSFCLLLFKEVVNHRLFVDILFLFFVVISYNIQIRSPQIVTWLFLVHILAIELKTKENGKDSRQWISQLFESIIKPVWFQPLSLSQHRIISFLVCLCVFVFVLCFDDNKRNSISCLRRQKRIIFFQKLCYLYLRPKAALARFIYKQLRGVHEYVCHLCNLRPTALK